MAAWLVGLVVVAATAATAATAQPGQYKRMTHTWEAAYAPWRIRESQPLSQWERGHAHPHPSKVPPRDLKSKPKPEIVRNFTACLSHQAQEFTEHVLQYRSPALEDVTRAVRTELDRRRARAVAVVFWGRER